MVRALTWVSADSHPLGPPKHVAGQVAVHLCTTGHGSISFNIANAAPAPEHLLLLPRVSRKGFVSVKLWQTLSLKGASEDFIVFLWGRTLPHCLVSARLTTAWDASGQKETGL